MRVLLTTMMLALAALPAHAAGLRTAFGEVLVEGLKIGQSYSLKELVNLPLRVVNTGEETVELHVQAIDATPDVLKSGFEIAPAKEWLRLESDRFTVEPNREAVTDVVITIPNDPKLLGRRFQADLWSRTLPTRGGMLAVGLRSRLLIQIDSTPPTEEELKKKFSGRRLANLDFTLLPTSGALEEVPVGREIDLRKEHKLAFKLVNPNADELNFRVRSIPNWEALLTVPPGFEAAYNPQWLKPVKEVVKLKGDSIAEAGLTLNIPDLPENRGKAFFFAVGVEVLEQEIPARAFYRLMIRTRK